MQWVLPSRTARRPSAVRDAGWFAQVIWGHQARERARIPSLIKRL
jgi:hypothetical protein